MPQAPQLKTFVLRGTVQQENICCLNTALVFFIIEREPAALLGQITDESVSSRTSREIGSPRTHSSPAFCEYPHCCTRSRTRTQVRGNFRELLQFWQAYYARKDRDRISLAFSSNLPFTVWQEAVDRLQRYLEDGLSCACD